MFLAVAVLVLLALFATSRRLYRLRRSRVASVLIAGGWPAVLVGFLLGEHGLGVVSPESLRNLAPLLVVGLGWIGMMVGLQLQRSVLRSIPRYVLRLTLVDALVLSLVVVPIASWFLMMWTRAEGGEIAIDARVAAALLPAAALLVAGAFGWSMETRSQRVTGTTPKGDHLAIVIRMAGALSAVVAITLFGLADKLSVRELGVVRFDAGGAALSGLLTILLGVFAALLGRYALELAGKHRGHQLAVFLGLVTFVAGVAAQTDLSPLLAAMVAGLLLTNLSSDHLERFSRFILRAEHAVAVFFALLAGVLLSPALHWWAVGLVLALLGVRLVVKPALTRAALRPERGVGDEPLPERSTLFLATARQSPIAMAMGVALVVDEWSVFHAQLLCVVLLIGVLSELVPTLMSYGRRSGAAGDEPAGESVPATVGGTS